MDSTSFTSNPHERAMLAAVSDDLCPAVVLMEAVDLRGAAVLRDGAGTVAVAVSLNIYKIL